MARDEARNMIGEYMELGNSRFTDREKEVLLEMIRNASYLDGETRVNDETRDVHDAWTGSYTIFEITEYTFGLDSEGLYVTKHYKYGNDDDDYREDYTVTIRNARELYTIYTEFFQ